MKPILVKMVCLALAIWMLPGLTVLAQSANLAAENITLLPDNYIAGGDANGDGKVNAWDVSLLQKHMLAIEPIKEEFWGKGDLNGDSAINTQDIALMQKIMLGLWKAPVQYTYGDVVTGVNGGFYVGSQINQIMINPILYTAIHDPITDESNFSVCISVLPKVREDIVDLDAECDRLRTLGYNVHVDETEESGFFLSGELSKQEIQKFHYAQENDYIICFEPYTSPFMPPYKYNTRPYKDGFVYGEIIFGSGEYPNLLIDGYQPKIWLDPWSLKGAIETHLTDDCLFRVAIVTWETHFVWAPQEKVELEVERLKEAGFNVWLEHSEYRLPMHGILTKEQITNQAYYSGDFQRYLILFVTPEWMAGWNANWDGR